MFSGNLKQRVPASMGWTPGAGQLHWVGTAALCARPVFRVCDAPLRSAMCPAGDSVPLFPAKLSLVAAFLLQTFGCPHVNAQCTAYRSLVRCHEVLLVLQADRHRYMKVKGVSAECRDVLSRMFRANPMDRATMADIMHHPWFKKDCPQV